MTKKCFFCSYPNDDDATRCINCGQKLVKYWTSRNGRLHLVDERMSKSD